MDNPLVVAWAHLQGNYKFQTACYVLYIYDHLLTLSDEIDRIWTQRLNLATLLFYINRYVTHGQFIILQVEFYETYWPISVCTRYVKFAGAATLCLITIAELIMILRIYGLYLGNKYILVSLLSILVGQIIVMGWSVHFGIRVPLPPGFPGCVLTGSSSWLAGIWGAPLVTDTCIFALTLWRTLRYRQDAGISSTIDVILRDGSIYFFVIFSVNLMNCLIYLLVVDDLKAMGASFSQIMTAILISRLQLNLRQALQRGVDETFIPQTLDFVAAAGGGNGARGQKRSIFFTIGNLGQDVEGSFIDTIRGTATGSDYTSYSCSTDYYDKDELEVELSILKRTNRRR